MSVITLNAQVTIGLKQVPNENAVLDLEAPNGNLGLLLPHVALTDTIGTVAPFTENVKGLLVYDTIPSANGQIVPGIYYNDGRRWWPANGGDGGASPWLISGSTTRSTSNTDNIYQMGQVGIGTSAAVDPTAALDVVATNKGVLFPRVALSSTTDETTIPSPTKGLLVFNTGEGGLAYTGYVFWDGNEWVSLTSGSLAAGTIGAITCNSVSITPSVYTADSAYVGTMTVPYTGSNGGTYPSMTIGPVNGLTATLAAGNFTPGAGTLAFAITGTPTVTTPETTTFSLNVGGQTCDAVVGAGDGIAPGDLVFYASNEFSATVHGIGSQMAGTDAAGMLSTYVPDLPVIGGKLRLDGYFSGPTQAAGGDYSFNPRLVNFTTSPVKLWFSAMTTINHYNGNNIVLAPGAQLNLDNGIYYTAAPNQIISNPQTGVITTAEDNTEVMTLDLQLDNKWYRIYYYPIVDNKDQTTVANMTRKIYLSIQRLY